MAHSKNKIIIGWGIAGACLAWELYRRNLAFTVYDNNQNYSSRVAAGIVNPIVFKRLTLSWQADKLMSVAEEFYRFVSDELKKDIFNEAKILFPFNGFEDENNWSVKMADERYTPYIQHTTIKSLYGIKSKGGFGQVNTLGSIRTNLFLDASKQFFEAKGLSFKSETFDYKSVESITNNEFIFCEGHSVIHNPYFNFIAMKPTHGETLTIMCKNLKLQHIISKNLFIQPLGNDLYKIGSTYKWDLFEPIITEAGKNDLIERLQVILELPFEIVKHEAGIRPTISDRRPVIGTHPHYQHLHLLNGLGTKGVLIAPYCANALVNNLIDKTPLPNEINVKRFIKEND